MIRLAHRQFKTTAYTRKPLFYELSGLGTSGSKIGNAHLPWAFGEAAALFLRTNKAGQKYLARLEKNHDQGQALSILAHQLARAVYYMLKRQVAFAMDIFLRT
jgi:hypothetical protein